MSSLFPPDCKIMQFLINPNVVEFKLDYQKRLKKSSLKADFAEK